MTWWQRLLGFGQDSEAIETRDRIASFSPSIAPWRTELDNFTTNRVSLQEYTDNRSPNALGLSATWACVNLIAGTIGTLPLMVYRATANGGRTVARDHRLYYVLHDSPNFDQTRIDFWEFMAAAIELQGNAYALIDRRSDGSLNALLPIPPQSVATRRASTGMIEYEWSDDSGRHVYEARDVLHIRGPLGNALGGLSTLTACGSVFSGAVSADTAASTMFANGMRPSGVLSTGETLTTPQKAELNGYLADKYQGAVNSGRPLLLDRGMTWHQINITPEDAQMLDSRKYGGEEICRLFGVPPSMVGYGDKASNWGTGVEQQMLNFKQMTLARRLGRIEQALTKQLLSPADRVAGITIEFNLEGLLRGDSLGRAQVNDIRLRNKTLTINEVRAQDNQPPVEWGDRPWVQMQDVQLNEDGTVPNPAGDSE